MFKMGPPNLMEFPRKPNSSIILFLFLICLKVLGGKQLASIVLSIGKSVVRDYFSISTIRDVWHEFSRFQMCGLQFCLSYCT